MTSAKPTPAPREIARKKHQRAIRFRAGKRLQKHTTPRPTPDPDPGDG